MIGIVTDLLFKNGKTYGYFMSKNYKCKLMSDDTDEIEDIIDANSYQEAAEIFAELYELNQHDIIEINDKFMYALYEQKILSAYPILIQ